MSHTPELDSFYVPDTSDSPAAAQVRLGLVHELGFEMLEAFKSIPRRGLEIGGILLGRVEPGEGERARPTIFVEGYETVECEHEYGPSYEFSPRDRLIFEQAVSRRRNQPPGEPRPVGFFRSQTGADPDFNEQDIGIARDLFSRQPALCLVVKPFVDRPGAARIGIWSDDAFHPLTTFPFKAGALLEGGFPIVGPPKDADGDATPAPAVAQVTSLAAPARAWHSWALSGAAAAMLLASLAIWARSHSATPAAPQYAPAPDSGVSLHVERRDGSAILSWNRAAPDAQLAQSALLVITDADKRHELRLNRAELQTGRVVYVPESDDVSFQLQLLAPGRSATESVRSVKETAIPPAPAPAPPPRASAKLQASQGDDDSGDATEPVPKPTFRAFPQFADAAPPPISAPPAVTIPVPPPPIAPPPKRSAPPPPGPKLVSSVTVEPVGPSAWKRVLGKVSPVHLLHRDDRSNLTPPQPLHEVQPRLSDDLLSEINGAVAVDVKVFVSPAGRVSRAELKAHDVNDRIADAVVVAARGWKFQPAHNDEGPVEGLALLHFQLRRSDATSVVASR